jgi:hypothetical protein
LFRADLFAMFLEHALFNARILGQHGQSKVAILRRAVAVIKIRGQGDNEFFSVHGVRLSSFPESADGSSKSQALNPKKAPMTELQ